MMLGQIQSTSKKRRLSSTTLCMPLKWATITQRANRAHRITSGHETVRIYTLLMENSVEDRIKEIVDRKFQYHQGVFKGAIADQAASSRMSASDLYYILSGG